MERWHTPAAHPELGAHQIHIWRAGLEVSATTLAALWRLLSSDEIERARRFVFERDRRRYVAARGVLRLLLAGYTPYAAGDLVFRYTPEGKPSLVQPGDIATLTFNLSHSDAWAVYGFTRQGRIGIDIEYCRALNDLRQLATSIFSEQELAALDAVPVSRRQAAFYAGWTRKEAFVKALGAGLSYSLQSFDVSLTPGEPARMLHVHADPAAALRWHLVAFTPAPNLAGAVVAEGRPLDVSFWHFPLEQA
nr:4'-phosphopantetheinyl transferase superfamily protein [Candidatus Chloroploca sp. Khr17]